MCTLSQMIINYMKYVSTPKSNQLYECDHKYEFPIYKTWVPASKPYNRSGKPCGVPVQVADKIRCDWTEC